jgi:cation transport protein ChaC
MRNLKHIRLPDDDAPLWVFGYGSLMWDPGFSHEARHVATIYGLHRRLCVSSIRYRGTPEKPGLVLGLDRGGCCRGYAYRISSSAKHEVAAYLEEREMVNGVYKPVFVCAWLENDTRAAALTFRVRREHPQYIPPMCETQLAERILRSAGLKGPNRDYVLNTVRELHAMGFRDESLRRLLPHLEKRPATDLSSTPAARVAAEGNT